MVLRKITAKFNCTCVRHCLVKKSYNLKNGKQKVVDIYLEKKNVELYKCQVCDNFHIGNIGNTTNRNVRFLKNYIKMSLWQNKRMELVK